MKEKIRKIIGYTCLSIIIVSILTWFYMDRKGLGGGFAVLSLCLAVIFGAGWGLENKRD